MSLSGSHALSSKIWTPTKPIQDPSFIPPPSLKVIARLIVLYPPLPPEYHYFNFRPTTSAKQLYKQVSFRTQKNIELEWNGTVIYPGNQTLLDMGFMNTETIECFSLQPVSPLILRELDNVPLTVEWTPRLHYNLFPKIIRDAIVSFVAIVRHNNLGLDVAVIRKIIAYIYYGYLQY